MSRDEPAERRTPVVPAVARSSAILDLLAEAGVHGLSASDIARELGLAKSSTANLCVELERAKLIRHNGEGFRLGPRLVTLAAAYLSQVDPISEFYTLCRNSRYIATETARLSLLDGLDVIYLARFDGSQPIRLTANIGDRLPAHITATGKAMLSTLPQEVVRDRYRGRSLTGFTAHSLTSVSSLLDDLAQTRQRGYAMDNEETTPGVVCYAVPIVDQPDEPARMAVSVTIIKARTEEVALDDLLAELISIARALGSPLRPRTP